MKKTISINLNSFIFNIDEDAYFMLSTYLEKLNLHFSKSEEGEEIVKDIEARIAEIFNIKISENKQVINITDVEEVINILGNIEDIVGDSENDENNKYNKQKSKNRKKLYRDTDNKKLAGVCAGLSAYTGIDVVFWRILFIIFLFVPGFISVIVYLILWLVVPEAKTIAEKIEMKEGKIDLSDIEKNVKDEYESLKKKAKNIDTSKFGEILNRIGNIIIDIFAFLAKIIGKIIGIVLIIVSIAIAIAFFIIIFNPDYNWNFYPNDISYFIWPPNVLQYITTPTISWILTLSLGLTIIIPIIGILYFGVSLLFKIKSNKGVGAIITSVWLISIIVSVCLILFVATSFRFTEKKSDINYIEYDKENVIYNFSLNSYNEELEKSQYNFNKNKIIKRYIPIAMEDDKILSTPRIEFTHTTDSLAKIKFTYSSKGINPYVANENINYVDYNYEINDSTTYFDQYFSINKNSWHFQNLRITVYIPVGSKIKIDENLEKISYFNQFVSYNENLYDKILLATEEGFVKAF